VREWCAPDSGRREHDTVGVARVIDKVTPGGAIAGGFAPTEIIHGGGTAMMGVANETAVGVPAPEPALHPPADHHFMLLEGIVFGISVGGVYVFSRTVYEVTKRFREETGFVL
jgi:hypothetical protein